jgi:archaellum component FlaC
LLEDEVAKENLQRESEYLVGEDKVSNENNITSIDRNIENKNNSITTATENIENIKHKVESINKKIEDVKSGDFEFSSPVQKVQVK